MPTYEHCCSACQHEWESEYSIKDDPPTTCPNCDVVGRTKRLISGGSGKGIVELTGLDLTNKIKSEAQILKKEMRDSDKVYANLLGEERYQSLQTQIDRAKLNRPKIKIRK